MFKRVVSLSFLLALILVQATPLVEAKSNEVPEKIVDKVAKDYLKKLKTDVRFKDKTEVIPFYDLDDNELGYYYQFETGTESYFMLLSSNTEYSPLLSAGSGEPTIKNLDPSGKLYYAGNITLFQAKNVSTVIDSINQIAHKQEKNLKQENNLVRIKKNPKAEEKWELYLSNTENTTVSTLASSERYISGVEIMNQWGAGVDYPASSCGPTTLATIAEYWRSEQGKSKIRGLNYYSEADMINHMWDTHGGTIVGMATGKLRDAIKVHSIEHGGSYTVTTDRFNSFTRYKSEIRAERPLAVKFDDWFVIDDSWGDEYTYDYHWTTGVGYVDENGDEILYIHDSAGDDAYIDYTTHEEIITMVSVDID